ncbi:MAG: CHC2 zinc finger domain-containing protein, partial [Pseudomonadota bacterium]
MALSDEVKARVSLRKLAEGDVTWDMTKSNPRRGDYWAPCPFHGEATASFHVTEPKGTRGVFKCFGCGVKGSCIDYLIERD